MPTDSSAQNILVIGPSWVGDMVMAQSLFKTLKLHHPNCSIDVIAPKWSEPVSERMPEIRHSIRLDIGHGEVNLKKRYLLGKSLRERYQQAIILPRSLKAALVPFFAQVPIRTGFLGEMRYGFINDKRALDKDHLDQTVKRFVALGLNQDAAQKGFSIPEPQLEISSNNQHQALVGLNLSTQKPAIALFPGAEYGPAKQWPIAYFRDLARQLVQAGYQVWVMGSQKDDKGARQISGTDVDKNIINLCGKTSIGTAIDLIAYCKGAISNDSGLMHVAAAAGCPVIAIYGSSSPSLTPPLSQNAQALYLNLECSPCFERQCPLSHLNCLHQIKPEQVFSTLTQLLTTVTTQQ